MPKESCSSHIYIRPQCYETWRQPQEKIWKDHKYMEVKEHPTKEWIGQQGNYRRNLKIHGSKWKWQHNIPKSLGCSKGSHKRKVYSNTGLTQEARKLSYAQPNLP